MVEANLYPVQPYKAMCPTVKNWHFKTDPDTPYRKQLPDDLAAMENITEVSIIERRILLIDFSGQK